MPTEKGLALYSIVKTMRIADVAMTGEWEKELACIERGEVPAGKFRKEIEKANRMLTDDEIRELLTKGKTGVLKGFKNKQGKRFDAALVFDADFNTGFVFPERKDGAASAKKRK